MTEKQYALAQAAKEREAAQNAATQDLEATQLVSVDDLKELERLQLAAGTAGQAGPAENRRRAATLAAVFGLALAAALLAAVLVVHAIQTAQPHATKTPHWGGR